MSDQPTIGTLSTVPATKPQPVLLLGAILAGLTFLFGGMGTVALMSDSTTWALVGALGTLGTAAVSHGLAQYTQGKVVPFADVATFVNADRQMTSGPAMPDLDVVEDC